MCLLLTVVHLVPHNMGLWRATLAQQRVQRCSTVVAQVWFQRGGWELCVLGMGGFQTLLVWTAAVLLQQLLHVKLMNDFDGSLKKSDLNYRVIGTCKQIKPCILKVHNGQWLKSKACQGINKIVCAFDKFTDISKVLQPLLSAKLAWCSNFTIIVPTLIAFLCGMVVSAIPHKLRTAYNISSLGVRQFIILMS